MSRSFLRKMKFSFVLGTFAVLFFNFSQSASGQKVRLRSQIAPPCSSASSTKYADIYADGNIAVQGSYNCRGAFIYDISNPDAPVLAAHYNPGNNQQFLEAIVVGNRGYFGSGNGGGVHIVDLSNPSSPQLLGIVNATNGNGFNSVHEIVIWNNILIENFNGFSNKILKFINVSNPASPVFIRDLNPTEANWVHAVHVRGNRMFTSGWGNSSNRGRTEIYDISNITTQAPTLLGFIEDPTSITAGNSMHSSWSSEDGNYLYSCRETSNGNGDVRVYNITNPAQPMIVNRIGMNDLNLNAVTPHNPVVMGNKLYVAWYQAGVQVFDLTNPAEPKRIGQYDTFLPQFNREENRGELTEEPWDVVCGADGLQNSLPTNYAGNWAVFPFLGENKVLAGDMTNGLFVLDVSNSTSAPDNKISDFDGDGKTDLSVFTPNSGVWQVENSSNGAFSATTFGLSQDKLVTGDYDGDGKSDIAVFRPSSASWYILQSTGGFRGVQFGLPTDVPVTGDFDADGKNDIAVWRPSNGAWYVMQSTLGFRAAVWGANGDKPIAGDFEGDGKTDLAVFRPSNGTWYILQSSSSIPLIANFGLGNDRPLSADFDGDGKSDLAVFRPATGFWYFIKSADSSFTAIQFGLAEDRPIPADYDGDGKSDISVFRTSANSWYRLDSANGAFISREFGQAGDIPSPSSVQP